MGKILCKNCNTELINYDNICSKCGSDKKAISRYFYENLKFHNFAVGKVKDQRRKLKYHFKVGMTFLEKQNNGTI